MLIFRKMQKYSLCSALVRVVRSVVNRALLSIVMTDRGFDIRIQYNPLYIPNRTMNPTDYRFWGRLCLAPKYTSIILLSSVIGGLYAQDNVEEDVYELDPFTVSEESVEGYIASNSLSGTRSNTPIKEIPLNIQVFTNELADDFLITNQVELERYNASMVNGAADVHSSNVIQQAYNNFFFRGFQQNWGLRDGVRQYDPVDMAGFSRVEVVKGPAAALFGLAYPGGIMNSVTKSVDFNRDFVDLGFTLASEGEYRAQVDANFSAELGGGQFGLRYVGVNSDTKDYRRNSNGMIQFSQINLAWKPTKATKFEFLAEYGYRDKTAGLGTFETAEVDANGNGLGNGASIPIQISHPDIPWEWNWSTNNVRSLETTNARFRVTHEFAPNFFVTGYWQYGDRDQIDSEGLNAAGMGGSAANWDLGWSSRGGVATGWLNPNTPEETIAMHWQHRDWQNKMWAYGVTAVYELNTDAMDNTFTVGANAWSEDFITFKGTVPEGSTSIVYLPVAANIEIPNPVGPPTDYFMDTAGAYETQDNSNDYIFASWQAKFLDGRLKTNLAVNRTNFKLVQWANGESLVPDNLTEASETSPLYGVVFDVTDEVSLFAINSTSLFPTSLRDSFQRQLPPLVGKSSEFGVKLDLMDGKVSGTISYYTITQEGGGITDPDAFNLTQQTWDSLSPAERELRWPGQSRADLSGDVIDGAETESKGYEADIVFQPTKNWQLLLSYAHNSIEISKHVNESLIGSMPYSGPIEDQLSFLTKYTFTDGNASGLSIGVGGQLAGESYQGTENGVDRYNPSTFYMESFAGYRFDLMGHPAIVRFNIKNLTEQAGFTGWQATGSSAVATKRYEVPTQRVYSVTLGVSF